MPTGASRLYFGQSLVLYPSFVCVSSKDSEEICRLSLALDAHICNKWQVIKMNEYFSVKSGSFQEKALSLFYAFLSHVHVCWYSSRVEFFRGIFGDISSCFLLFPIFKRPVVIVH